MVWMAPHARVPRRKDDHSIHCPFLDESVRPQWTATHNDWHVSSYVTSLHTLNQLQFLDDKQISLHCILILFHVSEGAMLYHNFECIPQLHRRPPYVVACMLSSQVWGPFITFRYKYVSQENEPANHGVYNSNGKAKVGTVVSASDLHWGGHQL
jgi:hypothetical protein